MTTSQQDLALIAGAAEANKELQSALTQRVDALTNQLKQLDLLIVSKHLVISSSLWFLNQECILSLERCRKQPRYSRTPFT